MKFFHIKYNHNYYIFDEEKMKLLFHKSLHFISQIEIIDKDYLVN